MQAINNLHTKLCEIFKMVEEIDDLIVLDEEEIAQSKSALVYISTIKRYTKHRKQRAKLYQQYLNIVNSFKIQNS